MIELRVRALALGVAAAAFLASAPAHAQLPAPGSAQPEEESALPDSVAVHPVASDSAIARRLTRILESTGWFSEVAVRVDSGVVFLAGTADSQAHRAWAGELAGKTEFVVAVVNRLVVPVVSPWGLDVLRKELGALAVRAYHGLPALLLGILVLALFWLAAGLARRLARRLLRNRIRTPLLLDLAARLVALPTFVLGIYLVLQIWGLTRLAITLLGGTGVLAIVVGIAFRDIMENFLASVLISMRRPFVIGDVVELGGHVGVVQKVTTRGTLLMAFDGNHVQIPNATVYKSQIVNYTANPKRRMEFGVGIGYDDDLAKAQETALAALKAHSAVLESPEPLVLVDALAASTVNLKLYFWYDGTAYDGRKIRSALIRKVKRALEEAGCSMPDEAREVIFPKGVPISQRAAAAAPEPERAKPRPAVEREATEAEGDLDAEQEQIQEQAAQARSPEEGRDLLAEADASRERPDEEPAA